MFSSGFDNFLPFSSNLKLSSANYFSLEESENLSFGKGLRDFETERKRILFVKTSGEMLVTKFHKSLKKDDIIWVTIILSFPSKLFL